MLQFIFENVKWNPFWKSLNFTTILLWEVLV